MPGTSLRDDMLWFFGWLEERTHATRCSQHSGSRGSCSRRSCWQGMLHQLLPDGVVFRHSCTEGQNGNADETSNWCQKPVWLPSSWKPKHFWEAIDGVNPLGAASHVSKASALDSNAPHACGWPHQNRCKAARNPYPLVYESMVPTSRWKRTGLQGKSQQAQWIEAAECSNTSNKDQCEDSTCSTSIFIRGDLRCSTTWRWPKRPTHVFHSQTAIWAITHSHVKMSRHHFAPAFAFWSTVRCASTSVRYNNTSLMLTILHVL